MKILEAGTPKGATYVFICTNCDNTIQAHENEGVLFIDSEETPRNKIIFECPVCRQAVKI